MYSTLLADARLYELLARIDDELATMARCARCGRCGGVLHSARYPRKPRGGPAVLPDGYDRRHSLCCAACRKRLTPASVRFLGRRVYLGTIVTLVSAMRQGVTPARAARLCALVGVSARTLARWRTWWREVFVETAFWKAAAGRFDWPVSAKHLPASLLERFGGDARERLVAALRFLSPITTRTARDAMGF